jgi:hypothetical protein
LLQINLGVILRRGISASASAEKFDGASGSRKRLDSWASCSIFVLMNEGDGQLHTLSVLEQLREASKSLWGASSAAYFRVDELLRQLANPNLHDIPRNLPFRVEMWDQSDQHIRWVIAASASVAVGHAAMDAAIANYPDQRFTLRNGILVIRQHPRG